MFQVERKYIGAQSGWACANKKLDVSLLFLDRRLIYTTQRHLPWLFQSASLSPPGRVSTSSCSTSEDLRADDTPDALCVNFVPVYREAADKIGGSDVGVRNDSVTDAGDVEKADVREIERSELDGIKATETSPPEVKI